VRVEKDRSGTGQFGLGGSRTTWQEVLRKKLGRAKREWPEKQKEKGAVGFREAIRSCARFIELPPKERADVQEKTGKKVRKWPSRRGHGEMGGEDQNRGMFPATSGHN